MTSREEMILRIISLHRDGMSARAIQRALRVSRNTVRRVLVAHAEARRTPHEAIPRPRRIPRARPIDPFRPQVHALLAEYPEITAQRVFEELRAAGFEGGHTAVKDYVREVRPRPVVTPSRPAPVYGPGKMAESDWATRRVELTGGDTVVLQIFAYVLTYSTRKYFDLFMRSDAHALMEGHVRAFTRFGGAAQRTKYDNQKAVVLRWEGDQPIYNPRFVAFATHYEFQPVACHPRRPNEKPRVERSFAELDKSFFNGRRFRDLDDIRAQLADWLDTVCDSRPHRKMKQPRLERFAEEQAELRSLPTHHYDTARVAYRLCDLEGMISWDGNRYAVPFEHITDLLPIRITEREVLVYAPDLSLVARHELAPKSAARDVGRDHYHRAKRRQSAMSLEQVEHAFARLGEDAAGFFAAMTRKHPRLAGYQGRQILLLREHYTTTALIDALRRAADYEAFDHKVIERILARSAPPRKLDAYVAEETARRLGEATVEPRDLDEYDRLRHHSSHEEHEERPCHEPSPPPKTSSASDSDDISKS